MPAQSTTLRSVPMAVPSFSQQTRWNLAFSMRERRGHHADLLAREIIFLDADFHPDGRRKVASTAAGKIALMTLLRSYATLVTRARAAAPRCLTPDQRLQANLKSEPPAWCIRSAKWPYHTPEWKTWLAERSAGRTPPIPQAK